MTLTRVLSLVVAVSICGCASESSGDAQPTSNLPTPNMDPDVVISASEFANRSSELPYPFKVPCPSTLAIPTNIEVRRTLEQETHVRIGNEASRDSTASRNVTGEWRFVDLAAGSQQVVLNLTVSTFVDELIFLSFEVQPNVKGMVMHAFSLECV